MFAYHIIFFFFNFDQEDSFIYSYLTSWINFITVHTLPCIYSLHSLYLFCCAINNGVHSFFLFQYSLQRLHFSVYPACTYFVMLLTIGSIALFLFQYSLQLSCGLVWYHVNPHFCYYVIIFIIRKCYNFFIYYN